MPLTKLRERVGKAKAKIVVAACGEVPEAISNPAKISIAVPAAATQHAERARRRPPWVGLAITAITETTPFSKS